MADETPQNEVETTDGDLSGESPSEVTPDTDAADGPTEVSTEETLPVSQQGVDEPMPAEIGHDPGPAKTMTTSAGDGDPVPEVVAETDDEVETDEDGEPLPELNIGAAVYTDGDLPEISTAVRGKIDRFGVAMGTGRRKTSVARVRIRPGSGDIQINGKPLTEFLCTERDQQMVQAPLKATEMLGKVDVWVRVNGGGTTGQTGAIVLGIARALQTLDPAMHTALAEGGYLTRDERMVERKKYGQAKARKSFQFSKR